MKYKLKSILIGLLISSTINISAQDTLTLKDIFASGKYYPSGPSGFKSMNDGESYSVIKNNKIFKYSFATGKEQATIFNSKKANHSKKIKSYAFSPDESMILLKGQSKKIYRHSTAEIVHLWKKGDTKTTQIFEERVMYADASADNKHIAFVSNNNLYIYDIANKKSNKITTDGQANSIINGAVDWVYEEEFSMSKGYQWDPTGRWIAYYKFDESKVPAFNMKIYGKLYPDTDVFKYPKAGEDNSIVDVYIYDKQTKKSTRIKTGSQNDQYLPRIQWTNTYGVLSIQRLNRHQNKLEILYSNASDKNGDIKVVYTENNKYYIDINNNYLFTGNGNEFLLWSEKDGYKHIYKYNPSTKNMAQITKGKWDIDKIYGYNKDKDIIFYSSGEKTPTEKHLYCIKVSGKGKKRISKENGTHSVSFSKGLKYYKDDWSTINTTIHYSLRNNKGEIIRVLSANDIKKENMAKIAGEGVEFKTLITAAGTKLNYWMIKPLDFDKNKKYPMLMYVYGGPGSQTVKNSWNWSNNLWFRMLAQKGYVIVSVDGRGTGMRGQEFKKMTYKELGKYEIEDQIAAAKYFGKKDYIDKNRIGMWGWSFGGYMSSLAISKGAETFKTAIAVAPVTSWRFYDNIYTERFMRTPQENASGYDNNSPINHVKKIKGNYLIIHGMADDNVHFQNAVMMIDNLIKNNIKFDSEFYPNKNHGIYGGLTRMHLYTRMTDYILDNL